MLRPYQQSALDQCRASFARGNRAVLLVLPTGGGKCLGPEVPVLMYSGEIKSASEVRVGDLLMGPDSKPRTVLSTCAGDGEMYRIAPVKGDPWTCNDVHVLTLVHTETGSVIDVPLDEWSRSTKWFKHLHKLFQPEAIDFPPQPQPTVSPYFYGLWVGDGTKALHSVAVSKPDPEVLAACRAEADRWGMGVSTRVQVIGNGSCPTHTITTPMTRSSNGSFASSNHLLLEMRRLWFDRADTIYIRGSRETRREWLAGVLDADGYLHHGYFEIAQKDTRIRDAIMLVARSLGFRVTCRDKYVNGDLYYRMGIIGDVGSIPCRIPRRQSAPRLQKKNPLRTGFSVESIGRGPYFGWELDGDGRFLLGDFTVTHNTVLGAEVVAGAIAKGKRVLWVAGRRELIDQAAARMPVPAGIVMAGRKPDPASPVQVASIDSVGARGEYPPADLVVYDEAHHIVARTSRQLLEHYPGAHVLGLTATPERADGTALGDVFDDMVVGVTVRELMDEGHLVECDCIGPAEESDALAQDPVKTWLTHSGGRPGFVFAKSVAHSRTIVEGLTSAGVLAAHVDGSTAKGTRDRLIDDFRRGRLDVLSSVYVFTEGTDVPRAAVCLMARGFQHASSYLQCVGRVLRPAPGKDRALLIDLVGGVHTHGLVDDDRVWSLDGEPHRLEDRAMALSQCPSCGAVWRSNGKPCPVCGFELPPPPPPKVEERPLEDLRERLRPALMPNASPEKRNAKWAELVALGRERGYKYGWAKMRYKAIFGEWRNE